jgi:hypothetical protein
MDSTGNTLTPEEQRRERVALETATHLLKGVITLPMEGYRARFSDQLNRKDLDFIALTDVERVPLNGEPATRHSFLSVARSAVLVGFPLNGDGTQFV